MDKNEYFVLKIPKSALPKTFHPEKDKFSLIFSGAELLILKKKQPQKQEEPIFMTLWGDIRSFHVPELLDILHLYMKTGILNFDLENNVQKTLYFRHGELIFAQSSEKEERLGETLLKEGKITHEQFVEASKEVAPGRHLGSILVDKGFIKASDLQLGIKTQLENIVISLFHYKNGRFYFLEGKNILDGIQKVDLNIDDLIIRGIKSTAPFSEVSDETNLGYIVASILEYNPEMVMLNPVEKKIVNYIEEEGGETSLLSIMRALQLREVTLFIALHRLARRKILMIQKSVAKTVMEAENEIVDIIEYNFGLLNQLMRQIDTMVKTLGKEEQFRAFINNELKGVLGDIKRVFENVQLYRDGTLNVAQVIENLSFLPLKDRKDLADRSISWLLSKVLEWGRKNLDQLAFEKVERLVKKYKENAK